MKIAIPEGLQIDAKPGGSAELLAKFDITEDNQLMLVSLDGVAVEAEEEPESEDEGSEEDMSDEELNSLMAGIGSEGSPAPMPSSEEYIGR